MYWKSKLKYLLGSLFPAIFFMALIFYMSSIPSVTMHGQAVFSIDKAYDKAYHIIEYFILALLLLRLFIYHKSSAPYAFAVAIAFAYGITDEVHQLFVPGRLFSIYDIVANGVGALLVLVIKKWSKRL